VHPITQNIDHIQGLSIQKRALCIALAGNHHILFTGQPGTGKTALLQCIPELLDALSLDELGDMAISRNCIPYVQRPQYHLTPTTSPSTLIGNKRIPGIVDHAHSGVIVLNELCEFNKKTIESLRICMESDSYTPDDTLATSSVLVCASSNNCPCGSNTIIDSSHSLSTSALQHAKSPHKTTPKTTHTCTCTPHQIKLYQSKLSEPVRDRFPIICNFSYAESSGHISLTHISNTAEISDSPQESETQIESETNTNTNTFNCTPNKKTPRITLKQTIGDCRYTSRKRNNGLYNQQLSLASIRKYGITDEASNTLDSLEHHFRFSHRKKLHTLRVARTIADLDTATEIDTSHILEAISYVKTTPFM
jgi:magnesium chelatase family protein